eukprot:scaffold254437_cov39-Tisochrysis_lutea.AAC.4
MSSAQQTAFRLAGGLTGDRNDAFKYAVCKEVTLCRRGSRILTESFESTRAPRSMSSLAARGLLFPTANNNGCWPCTSTMKNGSDVE